MIDWALGVAGIGCTVIFAARIPSRTYRNILWIAGFVILGVAGVIFLLPERPAQIPSAQTNILANNGNAPIINVPGKGNVFQFQQPPSPVSKPISSIETKADEAQMVRILSAAGPHRFQINLQTADRATSTLAQQIYDAFVLAGWTPNGNGPVPNFTSGIAGVMISGRTAAENPEIVPVLKSAFSRVGIDAEVDPSRSSHTTGPVVEIFVSK